MPIRINFKKFLKEAEIYRILACILKLFDVPNTESTLTREDCREDEGGDPSKMSLKSMQDILDNFDKIQPTLYYSIFKQACTWHCILLIKDMEIALNVAGEIVKGKVHFWIKLKIEKKKLKSLNIAFTAAKQTFCPSES